MQESNLGVKEMVKWELGKVCVCVSIRDLMIEHEKALDLLFILAFKYTFNAILFVSSWPDGIYETWSCKQRLCQG